MDRARTNQPIEGHPPRSSDEDIPVEEQDSGREREPNPPRTTTDGITLPKFGSAGSGGAELEPGPERD